MSITISRAGDPGPTVPAGILGHNIEMCLTTADGLLADRLRNPKFTGPPHRMAGVAPEWQGSSCGRGFYELTPGAGLMGAEAQLIRMPVGGWGLALHQNRVPVRAGEELELEIWARAWHQPVTLRVELRPLHSRSAPYDAGEITIDASWYKRYTLPLKAGRDDEEARLVLHVQGGGELWIDQIHLRPKGEALLCRELIDAMAGMRIPTLRFPGGIVCNAYNWRHGTGPVQLRPAMLEAAFHQDWHLNYDFGLDEYLTVCAAQGIIPALTLNVATGTPDEAREWAAYCAAWYQREGVALPRIDWHIANHPYHVTTAHMTPAMYIDVLKAFIPAVKAGYPDCRIIAPMARQALTGENEQTPWKEALLSQAAELVDVVEVQVYGGCDRDAAPRDQLQALAQSLTAFEGEMRAFIAESRARGARWKVGIAEWNWWMQASHWDGRDFEEPPTALHGLFIAGMIHRFAAMAPDFDVAHFYNLVNCMGILNHRGAAVEVTDAVAVFNLYRPALPGRLLPLKVETGTGGEVLPLDVLGLEQDGRPYLYLVNRGLEPINDFRLDGIRPEPGEQVTLAAASTTGGFTRTTSRVDAEPVTLPPLAIVRVS